MTNGSFRLAVLIAISLTTLIFFVQYRSGEIKEVKLLRVGCPTYWGSLVPSLQHTAYADALLSNQFEALVQEGSGGAIIPGLAKSWEVNSDFTSIKFNLHSGRRFSNGQNLTSEVVKEAWEYGLSLPSKSTNSSLQDVMYLIKGFNEFKHTKKLSGVRIIDELTFQVEFIKPFRTALAEFGTGRMSVFIRDGESFLGTGPYVIHLDGESKLSLSKNAYYSGPVGFENIEVKVVGPERASRAIESGEIDVYAFADRAAIDCDGAKTACLAGMESAHSIVVPNGMTGRLFANSGHRLALQYLIQKHVSPENLPENHRRNLQLDPQVYLKLQPGRLRQERVGQLIAVGEQYVQKFVEATQVSPLYLVTSESNNWIQDLLEKVGVRFDPRSGSLDTKDRVQMYYKTFKPDLFVMGTSVASGDPDGLFHILAKDGAIMSPVLFREKVSRLLEAGRALTDIAALDGHYSKVSEAVLQEVPFVHIGFARGLFAYNKDRVKTIREIKEREGNQFTLFTPR